eukprot:763014-Hanusia_phi.AAC.4
MLNAVPVYGRQVAEGERRGEERDQRRGEERREQSRAEQSRGAEVESRGWEVFLLSRAFFRLLRSILAKNTKILFDKNNETEKKLASYATHDKEVGKLLSFLSELLRSGCKHTMGTTDCSDAYQFILENVVPFIKSAYKLEQQDIISQADFVQKV